MPAGRPQHPILVVDDDSEIRELLHALLTDEGYRVLLASHAAEAFALAASEALDLILLDLVMPLFDAADFCRAYRDGSGTAPVVLLSAAAPDVVAAAVGACRATAHLLKPFDVTELLEVVRRLAGPA